MTRHEEMMREVWIKGLEQTRSFSKANIRVLKFKRTFDDPDANPVTVAEEPTNEDPQLLKCSLCKLTEKDFNRCTMPSCANREDTELKDLER